MMLCLRDPVSSTLHFRRLNVAGMLDLLLGLEKPGLWERGWEAQMVTTYLRPVDYVLAPIGTRPT